MLYKLLEIIRKIIKKSITDKEIRSTLFNLLIRQRIQERLSKMKTIKYNKF
jgi:hypothetical protein